MKSQDALKFWIQVLFSSFMIGFCSFQLVRDSAKETQALYWGGLSGVLAYWLPSPASEGNSQFTSDKEAEKLKN